MKLEHALLLATLATIPAAAADPAYVKSVEDWRAKAETGLRRDNGWLTLAGRYVMKPGENTFGTGEKNDIVFPKGLGAERMGTIGVEPGKVTLTLASGVTMEKDGTAFTERVMGTDLEKRDWVSSGRIAFHVIEREGRYILRLADNESQVRKNFHGRVWFDVNDTYKVKAKFVPYKPLHNIAIVNGLDEVSDEPSPAYVQFTLKGKTYKLDVVGDDDDGLFMIMKDDTAGKTTYGSGPFLHVEKKPPPNQAFDLDLNLACNPPCAFSEFSTCPRPPRPQSP